MVLPKLSRFVWWIIGTVIVLIILALLRVSTQLGAGGFHITQGLAGEIDRR